VSCYTLLSGFRLPWPPSCCQDEPTPFVVSDERGFRRLNLAFGSSRIASSAYQKWPTRSKAFDGQTSIKKDCHLTYLKFESRLRALRPQGLQSFALPHKTAVYFCYPEGNFGRNQLLDGSISLSPLCSDSTIDLHVRIATSLHQSFLWLHPIQA
jgi:hypothetical protein